MKKKTEIKNGKERNSVNNLNLRMFRRGRRRLEESSKERKDKLQDQKD